MLINTHTKSFSSFWNRLTRRPPPEDPVETTAETIGGNTFQPDPGIERLVQLSHPEADQVVTRLLEATRRGEDFEKVANLVHRADFTPGLRAVLEPRLDDLARVCSRCPAEVGPSAYTRGHYLRRLAQVFPEAMNARVFREEVLPLVDEQDSGQVLNILATGGAFGAAESFRDEAGEWALAQPLSGTTRSLFYSLSRDGWRPRPDQVGRFVEHLETAMAARDDRGLELLLGLGADWKAEQPDLLAGRGLEEKLVEHAFAHLPPDQLQLSDLSPTATGLVARIYAVAFPNETLESRLLDRVEQGYQGDLAALDEPGRQALAALLSRSRTAYSARLVELLRPELERFHPDMANLRLAGGVMREWLRLEETRIPALASGEERTAAALAGITTLLRCEEAARDHSNLNLSDSVRYFFLRPLPPEDRALAGTFRPDGRATPEQLARLVVCEHLAEGVDRVGLADLFGRHYLDVVPTPGAEPAFNRLRAERMQAMPEPSLEDLARHERWLEQAPSLRREVGRLHEKQRSDWLERELPFLTRAREVLPDDGAVFTLAAGALAQDPQVPRPVVWRRLEQIVQLSHGRSPEQMASIYERLLVHLASGLSEEAALVYALQESLLREEAPTAPPPAVTLTEEELWIGGTSIGVSR